MMVRQAHVYNHIHDSRGDTVDHLLDVKHSTTQGYAEVAPSNIRREQLQSGAASRTDNKQLLWGAETVRPIIFLL